MQQHLAPLEGANRQSTAANPSSPRGLSTHNSSDAITDENSGTFCCTDTRQHSCREAAHPAATQCCSN